MFPSSPGTPPVRKFELRSRPYSHCILPRSGGMPPLNSLESRLHERQAGHVGQPRGGMLPLSWLSLSSRLYRLVSLPSSGGMLPLSSLEYSRPSILLRLARFPKAGRNATTKVVVFKKQVLEVTQIAKLRWDLTPKLVVGQVQLFKSARGCRADAGNGPSQSTCGIQGIEVQCSQVGQIAEF